MDKDQNQPTDEVADLVGRGFELLSEADAEGALGLCLKARELAPQRFEYLYLMGLISLRMNRLADALECMKQGHQVAPDVREFSAALASLYAAVGHLADSIFHAKLTYAQQSHPLLSKYAPDRLTHPEAALDASSLQGYYQEAFFAYMAKNYERAQDQCESELRLNPNNVECMRLFARVLMHRDRHHQAADALRACLAMNDVDPDVPALLAEALMNCGEMADAIEMGEAAVQRAPDNWDVLARVIHAFDRLPDDKAAVRAALVGQWRDRARGLAATPLRAPQAADFLGRKFKIAYLLNDHSITHYLDQVEAVLDNHDGAHVEASVYQLYLHDTDATARLRGKVANWRELCEVDDFTAAHIIAGEGVDVLVDMTGMTPGARPNIICQHPAPLQVAWLSAEASGGGIDCVLVDPVSRNALPEGVQVLEMPGGVFCMPRSAIMVSAAEAIEAPAAANGYVTFGATLDLARIPAAAELWARILNTVRDSRLRFGNGIELTQPVLEALFTTFDHYGVADRIIVDLPEPGRTVEPFWSKIDILLASPQIPDPFEVAEALAMGVPVVVRHGNRLAHARTAGVLAQAGQGHWIADDDHHYLSIAASMAQTPQMPVTLRGDLLANIGNMPLCNTELFTRAFEQALIQGALLPPEG
ncbi:MAG: hypothetical protein ACM31L_19655 [Actinomycetota bacterium]